MMMSVDHVPNLLVWELLPDCVEDRNRTVVADRALDDGDVVLELHRDAVVTRAGNEIHAGAGVLNIDLRLGVRRRRGIGLLDIVGDRNHNVWVVHARVGHGYIENRKPPELLDDVKGKWNVAEV